AAALPDAVARAQAYLAAGADGIYPIGLNHEPTLKAFIAAVDAPVNVAAGAGIASLAALEQLGVARVSTATRLSTLALGTVDKAVRGMLATGTFDSLASDFTYMDVQRLFD